MWCLWVLSRTHLPALRSPREFVFIITSLLRSVCGTSHQLDCILHWPAGRPSGSFLRWSLWKAESDRRLTPGDLASSPVLSLSFPQLLFFSPVNLSNRFSSAPQTFWESPLFRRPHLKCWQLCLAVSAFPLQPVARANGNKTFGIHCPQLNRLCSRGTTWYLLLIWWFHLQLERLMHYSGSRWTALGAQSMK